MAHVWDPLFSGHFVLDCPLSEVKKQSPFGTLKLVLCSEVISLFGVSFIGGSTVVIRRSIVSIHSPLSPHALNSLMMDRNLMIKCLYISLWQTITYLYRIMETKLPWLPLLLWVTKGAISCPHATLCLNSTNVFKFVFVFLFDFQVFISRIQQKWDIGIYSLTSSLFKNF